MKLKILKDFRYGSISDPQLMKAGNIIEWANEFMAKEWIKLGWAEEVE